MNTSDSKMSAALRSRIRDLIPTAENQYSCFLDFDAGFTGFEGHFEGNPIVPGVCLIETARVIAEEITRKTLRTGKISQARFRRPILAGERAYVTVKLTEQPEDRSWKIQTDFRVGTAVSAQLRMELEAI